MSETQYVRARHATKHTGHPVLKYLAFTVLGAAAFGAVFTQTYAAQLESRITTEDISPLLGPDRPDIVANPVDGAAGKAVNILLMGSDDRSGENAAIGGEEAGLRNDTTLLMHISADRTRVELVSIPRDTMVQIADCDRSDGTSQRGWFGQFNTAFANGAAHGSNSDGAACVIKTVEGFSDIYIDHFAVIDFAGFRDMVDAIGGVPMCIPVEYADPYSGTYLQPGPQVLNGSQAISYVRMRHGANVSGSDLDRIDRQQEFLKNMAKKVLSAEMLYRPQDITNFLGAVADSLTVDPQMGDLTYVAGLGFSLRNLDPSAGIVMATAPIGTYPADPNRVQFTSAADAVWSALATDQPIAPLLDSQSASPANEAAATAAADGPVAPAQQVANAGPAAAGAVATSASVDPNSQDGILNTCNVG